LYSISKLNATIIVVDSFSTDNTVEIAESFGCKILQHVFVNHPSQWDYALKNAGIDTPWTIGLDADQVVTEHLANELLAFKNSDIPAEFDGIYFNRQSYFQGKRLKYGTYKNFYQLKMFKTGIGYSDTNENMDHRFIVPGKTIIWKKGILKEDNLKEYDINFWIQKHIKYSDLVAHEEYERMIGLRKLSQKARLNGNKDQKVLFFKKIWWQLPLFVRPTLYFIYRFIFRLGILENRSGRIFHYLQGFWFRYLVDIKLYELKKKKQLQYYKSS